MLKSIKPDPPPKPPSQPLIPLPPIPPFKYDFPIEFIIFVSNILLLYLPS